MVLNTVEKLLGIGRKALYDVHQKGFADLESVIMEVVDHQHQALEAKKNTVHITNLVNEPVFLDVQGLQLVLSNLLSNANKYSSGSTTNTWLLKEGEKLIIKVADEGRGMDKKTIGAILENMPLTSAIGTHNETGAGIALLLTREYLRTTGGEMYISSALNVGTTFTLVINDVQFVQHKKPSKISAEKVQQVAETN
jgi:two-component system, sensor histidine kinase and response regulator